MPYFILITGVILIVGTISTFTFQRTHRREQTALQPPRLSNRWDRRRRNLPRLLVEWALRNDKHGVGSWLDRLTAKELRLMTKDVAVYARDMGFDLLWVVDGQIHDDNLREDVNKAVYEYLYSFFVAANFQNDMRFHIHFVDFLNNLYSRQNRPKAQQLFKHLVDQGLILHESDDILFENRIKRETYVSQQILQAAQTDLPAVKRIAYDVLITQSDDLIVAPRESLVTTI